MHRPMPTFLKSCKIFKNTYCNMPHSSVLIEKVNEIMLIGLNRPRNCNALNNEAVQALNQALDQLDSDVQCKAGVIYGVGGNFCSGYDLNEIASMDQSSTDSKKLLKLRQSSTQKILIAAVEGFAVGAGLELALMCDLRIASESSKFGFLNRRFGVPLRNGGTVRLPKVVGMSRAMDLILTGRCIDANMAFQWGLVKHTVSIGAALGQAVCLASQLVQFPQDCINADRSSTYFSTFDAKSEQDALQFEYEKSQSAFSNEAPAGMHCKIS